MFTCGRKWPVEGSHLPCSCSPRGNARSTVREGHSHTRQELSRCPWNNRHDPQDPDAEKECQPLQDMGAGVLGNRGISLVQGPDLAQLCPSGTIDRHLLKQMGNLRLENTHFRETPLEYRGEWGAALGEATGWGSASPASGCPEPP